MSSANKQRASSAAVPCGEDDSTVQATPLTAGLMLLSVSSLSETTTPLPPEAGALSLSPAEWIVVRLAAIGFSNSSIAKERGCSARTVANQLASAYRKLGVRRRREMRALLLQHGVTIASILPAEPEP